MLNDEINIISFNKRLTNKNALYIISDYDIVIDGTDNFSSRYMINDACILLKKPSSALPEDNAGEIAPDNVVNVPPLAEKL